MIDALKLLLAGAAFAAVGWAFWHVTGSNGWTVLSSIALLILAADNVRLRRKLRGPKAT